MGGGGRPGGKKAVSGFCSAAFRIFFPTKKQPHDLLMIHLRLLFFVPEGASRLVEMNRLPKSSFACVVWSAWLCNVLGRQFWSE